MFVAVTMDERYRRWFEYEKEAHEKVLSSLRSVPESRHGDRMFQKAIDLFGHIAAARGLWLHRFGVADKGPDEIFPQGVSLASLGSRVGEMHAAWSAYLGRVDEAELARQFDYRSLEGERYRNRVEDLLTQLFGHSWYHRGQIAALVRSCGGQPAVTDYLFWTRELLE
jgi:uncharacterized damage-inducible protein DinB